MKLCTRIEGVRERLWDGSLTLDAAAQLQHAFERRDRSERRDRERVLEVGGAGAAERPAQRPNGSAPAPEPDTKPTLDVSAQKALVERAAGKSTREVAKMLAEVDPALAVPADRVRPLGEGRWELKAVIDVECERGLEQLRGLLSHVDPHMTLGQLVGRLVREGLDRHDPARPPRRGRIPKASAADDRPPAAKRKEMRRQERHAGGESVRHGLGRHGFCGSGAGRPIPGSPVAGAAIRAAGMRRQFARECAAERGPSCHFGAEAAGGPSLFGAEGAPAGGPHHSGGGQARLAARRRTLALRRSVHGTALPGTALSAGRSRVPVRPGRQCGAGESPTAVLRAPPRPPRGADFTARATRVSTSGALPERLAASFATRKRRISPRFAGVGGSHIEGRVRVAGFIDRCTDARYDQEWGKAWVSG